MEKQQYPDLFDNRQNVKGGSLQPGTMQRDVLIPNPKAPKEPIPDWKEIVDPLLHGRELRSGGPVERKVFPLVSPELDVASSL